MIRSCPAGLALALLALAGVGIFAALSLLEYALLRRWHASARNNI